MSCMETKLIIRKEVRNCSSISGSSKIGREKMNITPGGLLWNWDRVEPFLLSDIILMSRVIQGVHERTGTDLLGMHSLIVDRKDWHHFLINVIIIRHNGEIIE